MKKSALRKELKALRKKLTRRPKAKPTAQAASVTPMQPPLRVVGPRLSQNSNLLVRARQKNRRNLTPTVPQEIRIRVYEPPPGVLPDGQRPIAMDSAQTTAALQWAQSSLGAYWAEGLTFMGYPELANLTVRPEYRVISQVIATECTRKWITFQSSADEEAAKERAEFGANKEGELEDGQNPLDDEQQDDDEASQNDEDAGQKDEADLFAKDKSPEDAFVELQQAKQEKDEAKEQANAEKQQQIIDKMTSKDDKSERIKELNDELERLCVRDLIYKIVELDGWFGRAHLYIDTGLDTDKNPDELMAPIGDGRDDVTRAKFKQGTLKRFAVIEPLWTYPQDYNSNNPLREDWYNPSMWFVMGKRIHCSRLLTFVGRPVPDLLKPVYAFGGLSLSQICKPYVDNWLQTRQSVNDIIHAFSVMVLQTDLSSVLQVGGGGNTEDLFARLDMFNQLRDNRGVFAVDKESEDFKNVAAPISGLDQLQAQAQEHMAAVSRIPLVKLLGISPHGLNASSEGELKAFYDTIAAFQESFLRPKLTTIINFVMMNLWGEVDDDIHFKFEPLEELNAKEQAEVRKIEAETDDILVNGVAALHPVEVRKRIATDPNTPYEDIDVADLPEAPADPEGALGLSGHKPFSEGAQAEQDPEDPDGGAGAPPGRGGSPFGGSDDAMPEELSGLSAVHRRSSAAGRQAAPGRSNREKPNSFNESSRASQGAPGKRQGGASSQGGENPNHINKGLVFAAEDDWRASGEPVSIGSPERILRSAREFLTAIAEDAGGWNEADHPRVKSGAEAGQFTSGGGGSSGPSEKNEPAATAAAPAKPAAGQYAGMYETKGASPKENHDLTVAKVVAKPAQKGIHYRRLVAHLIKEAPKFGTDPQLLKAKLYDALLATHDGLIKKGKYAEAEKIGKAIQKLDKNAPPLKTAPQPAAASPKAAAPAPAAPAPSALAKPTAAELEAAKKTTGYYPTPNSPEGKKIAEKFDDKYKGKALTDPHALTVKIQDYKLAKAAIAEHEQKYSVTLQENAKKEAAAQAEKQKAMAKEVAEKNKKLMADLGINEQEALGFGALAKMLGASTNQHDLVEKFKHYEKEAEGFGYPISGFQSALIANYSNGGYSGINKQLRSGAWTEAQHVYVKMVNKALAGMPTYKGTVRRQATLNNEQQNLYQVGHIVEERAFTSTSAKENWTWGGNTNFVITAIGKRGASIQKLSNHPGEKEVLFQARTFFKVTKVDTSGNQRTVHMEEMDD